MCQATTANQQTQTFPMPTPNSQAATTVARPGVAAARPLSDKPPVEKLTLPSLTARYTCAGIMVAIFAVWGQLVFVTDESLVPGGAVVPLHSWKVPVGCGLFYLVSLPLLRNACERYLWKSVDVKTLLTEAMIVYNAGQVLLNLWMVYRIFDALLNRGHPFIGADPFLVHTGTTYAIWVHYCDKYLEFMDTYFMVLRGKMDQVSFLHVYHHVSISLAWWFAIKAMPGGDSYFGALVNSWIHVMMYSYYTLALCRIRCPWKRYLTQAQLVQFVTVVLYTAGTYALSAPGTSPAPHLVQFFEMTSLLVLFLHFYRTTYQKRKREAYEAEKELSEAVPSDSVSSASSSDDGER